MLRLAFERDGYAVVTAASAAEGLRLLAGGSLEAVITDMKLESDTAGYEMVRAARALARRPAILILTAYPLWAHEWRAAGADAVASKPSNMTNYWTRLTTCCANAAVAPDRPWRGDNRHPDSHISQA